MRGVRNPIGLQETKNWRRFPPGTGVLRRMARRRSQLGWTLRLISLTASTSDSILAAKTGGNMDGKVLAQVRTSTELLHENYRIKITSQATLILGECFTAILEDAHRSWPIHENKQTLERFKDDMINALPSTLASFAYEAKLTEVTSFDLLHGMTRIIDHMCPFVKPPP
jgi:hypothetical protein